MQYRDMSRNKPREENRSERRVANPMNRQWQTLALSMRWKRPEEPDRFHGCDLSRVGAAPQAVEAHDGHSQTAQSRSGRSPAARCGSSAGPTELVMPRNASHRPLGGVSCKNIRLNADVAKSLSRSRNWRADGDGCAGLHAQRVNGVTGFPVSA